MFAGMREGGSLDRALADGHSKDLTLSSEAASRQISMSPATSKAFSTAWIASSLTQPCSLMLPSFNLHMAILSHALGSPTTQPDQKYSEFTHVTGTDLMMTHPGKTNKCQEPHCVATRILRRNCFSNPANYLRFRNCIGHHPQHQLRLRPGREGVAAQSLPFYSTAYKDPQAGI